MLCAVLQLINTGVKSFVRCDNKSMDCAFRLAQEVRTTIASHWYCFVAELIMSSHQLQGLPSNATLFQYLFTVLFKISATCFGRATIFRRKSITCGVSSVAVVKATASVVVFFPGLTLVSEFRCVQ
jgi:hypothetical protein